MDANKFTRDCCDGTINRDCCDGIINSCCKHFPDKCYNLSSSWIRDVVYSIDNKLSEYIEWIISFSKWGYGKRDIVCQISEEEAEDLRQIRHALTRYLRRRAGGFQKCLTDCEVQSLLDRALSLVDMSCVNNSDRQDVVIDRSGYNEWAVKNPYCVPFESWENAFGCIAPEIGFKVVKQVAIESLRAFFKSKNLGTLTSKCEVLYTLDVIEKALNCKIEGVYMSLVDECKVDGKVSVSEMESCAFKYNLSLSLVKKCISTFNVGITFIDRCKVNYDLLNRELPRCEISFEVYMQLVTCNLSHDLISKAIDCGINLDYNVNKDTPEILLEDGSKLAFCDFTFDLSSKINCETISGVIDEDFCHHDKSYEIIKILNEYNS